MILAGPSHELLRRFYATREQVWLLENTADPYRGRQLRGLLERARFDRVTATSKYFCYGTGEAVESFGLARAEDCGDGWYARSARKHALATASDLDAMSRAWLEWSKSPDAAFDAPLILIRVLRKEFRRVAKVGPPHRKAPSPGPFQ